MEKVLTKRVLVYVTLALTTLSMIEVALCYEPSLVHSIRGVYSRLAEAEKKGADVRDAALKLEKALELVRAAEDNPRKREALLSEASKLVEEVNSSIPLLIEEGERRMLWRNIILVSVASLVVVSAALTYYYGPRMFWGIWLRLRSRWVIEFLGKRREGVRERDRR